MDENDDDCHLFMKWRKEEIRGNISYSVASTFIVNNLHGPIELDKMHMEFVLC